MLASNSLLSDVTVARDLLTYWPIEGAGQEGHMRKTLRLYVTANDW